ncbi:MAG: hypothetical protein IKK66_03130 [Ruminococcus sp.]|nr:hypothetical protein [Ruminococcus sp.]
MTNNENNTNAGFDLSFIKAFLDSCEKQNRFNISVISSICLELAESGEDCDEQFRFECANRIINQCSQIMKLTDIYSLLSDLLNESEFISECTNITSYLSQFVSECNNMLKSSCSLSFTGGENVCSDIIKRLLDFILVMYVRKSVLFGARDIEVSSNVDNENIIINLKITNKDDTIYFNIPETFSTDFSEEIIREAAIKMKGEYFVDSKGMKLVFPIQKSKTTKLNSSAKSYGKPVFSIIKNILSDLSDISLI